MGSTTSTTNSLYVHTPFCTKKCPYCHFYVLPYSDEAADLLMSGLQKEWEEWRDQMGPLASIYFGGGTPALLGPERIGQILEWLGDFDCEVTLEANPGEVNLDDLKEFQQVGVNRLSLGVQSFDPKALRVLGREHQVSDVIELAEGSPIQNISIDLMYDLPGQTLASWRESLKAARDLPVTHVSLYNLTFEPGTVFFKERERLQRLVPGDELSAAMYTMAQEILEDFNQYEISAFARNGKVSVHNLGYWQGREFIGLGPSAFSYWKGERFRNIARLNRWAKGERADYRERLDEEAAKRERVVIGLRVLEGVEEEIEGMERMREEGLLEKDGTRWRLSDRGILMYDWLASELI